MAMPLLFCCEAALSSDSVRWTSDNRCHNNSNEPTEPASPDCSGFQRHGPMLHGKCSGSEASDIDGMCATLLIYKHKHAKGCLQGATESERGELQLQLVAERQPCWFLRWSGNSPLSGEVNKR